MPLQGGYDVQIGGYKFRLDLSRDEPYSHYFVPVSSGQRRVAGELGGETLLSDEVAWSYTDWSGGEGNRIWYPDDPAVYDYAEGLNTRIPGQATGRPARNTLTVAVSNAKKRPYFALGAGRLWIGCDQTLKYSTDQGATWTDATAALGLAAGWTITAMTGDHEAVYVAARDSTQKLIRKVYFSGGAPTGADVVAAHVGANPWVGLCIMGGRLYGWTGRKLMEFDIASTLPLVLNTSYRKVYDTGIDIDFSAFGGSQPGSWWADAHNAENSVIFFMGMEGHTVLYEYDGIAGRPIWDPMPFGLTAKSMKVQNGVVYIAGHWSGESQPTGGFGCMYAVPLDNPVPLFLGWFRKPAGENLQMQEMANSYGNQIMVAAAKSGKIFVYDADYDAISMLDNLNLPSTDKIGDMITVGQKRLVAVYQPQATSSTQVTIHRYNTDEPGDRETSGALSGTLYMGDYDAGLPHEAKSLYGFHVTFKPLVANQRITIDYDPDNAGTYISAGTITSATQGAMNGRVYLSVATANQRFFRLKVRITLDNNGTTGVALPILYGVSPVARPVRNDEYWDLWLRFKDERQVRGRPTARALLAEQIRDFLMTAAQSDQVVTFLDGARYASAPSRYTTHTVTIEEVKDIIIRPGSEPDRSAEGSCFVRLKAVPS